MRILIFSLALLFVACQTVDKKPVEESKPSQDPFPKAVSGKIERIPMFKSKYVTPRNIDVWLPAQYDGKKAFPVLYMHDGKMLYDKALSWTGHAWEVDDTIDSLSENGRIQPAIVVGIYNGDSTRHCDYFPAKPFLALSDSLQSSILSLGRNGHALMCGEPRSDAYLKSIVEEIKPLIDKKYNTKPDQANTYIAGSSMGGLISMYAICEYPEVFGGAACLSTHWIGIMEQNDYVPKAFQTYLSENVDKLTNHKLYFDYGDQTLDAEYLMHQPKVDSIIQHSKAKGLSYKSEFYPGHAHTEKDWEARLHVPIEFLLGE